MNVPHDIERYVKLTHASNVLRSLRADADALHSRVSKHTFEDEHHEESPNLYNALFEYVEDAGKAATGEGAPLDAGASVLDYSLTIARVLDDVTATARSIANRAEAVAEALRGGLLTDPRDWTAADIEAGAMLELIHTADEDGYGDPVWLWASLNTLVDLQSAGLITEAVFDRHMNAIYELGDYADAEPAHEAGLLESAMNEWHERTEEDAAAFATVLPTIPARQRIHATTTYSRLARYAADLRSTAWDEERRTADMHMRHIYRHANALGTDQFGKTREDAADLFEALEAWRSAAYDACMALAETAFNVHATAGADAGESAEWAEAQKTAYRGLFDATDLAVSTGQLLDIWQASAAIDDDQRANIRVGVLLHFEESRTDTGLPLADGGAFADHTKRLRAEVDAHPIGKNSNIRHTVHYRGHRDTIADINTDNHHADHLLSREWGRVVANADGRAITRRQLRALRDLVNAKVAQWCEGDEYRAAALMSRLPEWDRITDELAN